MSYDETQVTSSWTGSGAIRIRRVVIREATIATWTASSAIRIASSLVSTTPEAKPHAPWWITRTAKPSSSWSLASCSAASRTARLWERIRSNRKSAWATLKSRARLSAASASLR